ASRRWTGRRPEAGLGQGPEAQGAGARRSARALRREDTEAEAKLWSSLRDRCLAGWRWRLPPAQIPDYFRPMNTEDVLNEFRGAGALREGHFILSSGLHSGVFLQKNLVFQHPDRTERLCKALAAKITAAVGQVDI